MNNNLTKKKSVLNIYIKNQLLRITIIKNDLNVLYSNPTS